MKKPLLVAIIFISGLIVGSIASLVVFGKFVSDSNDTEAFINISELESLASNIYKTGDYESSVIVLNHIVNKLKLYEDGSDKPANTFRTDRGIAHGRLYIVYKNKGEEELSEKEYRNAMELLGKKYNITTKNDLVDTIEKFDKTATDMKES